MDWYKNIKLFYDWGIYTQEEVQLFVTYGQITQEQADSITGKTTPPSA